MSHTPYAAGYPYAMRPQARYAVVGDAAAIGLARTPSGGMTRDLPSLGRQGAYLNEVATQQMPSIPPGTRVIVAAGNSEVIGGTRVGMGPQHFDYSVDRGMRLVLEAARQRGVTVSHVVGPINPMLLGAGGPDIMRNAQRADQIMGAVARQYGVAYVSTFQNDAALRGQMSRGADLYSALRTVVAQTPTNTAGAAPYGYHNTSGYPYARPPGYSVSPGYQYGQQMYHTPQRLLVRRQVAVDAYTGQYLGEMRPPEVYARGPSYGAAPYGYGSYGNTGGFSPSTLIAGVAGGVIGGLIARGSGHSHATPTYHTTNIYRTGMPIAAAPTTIVNNIIRPPHQHHHGHMTPRPVHTGQPVAMPPRHVHAGQPIVVQPRPPLVQTPPMRTAAAPPPPVQTGTRIITPPPAAVHQRQAHAGAPHHARPHS